MTTVRTVPHVAGRVVVVGDIHGCLDQLQKLLKQLNFCQTPSEDGRPADLCVFVGDLVNKGPKSFDVVRFLRRIGAAGVCGNHDLRLVRLVETIRAGCVTSDDRESSLYSLAATCPDDVFTYLKALPHILRIPQHRIIVVHAGVDPTLALEAHNVETVTRLRNLATLEEYKEQLKTKKNPKQALGVSSSYAAMERGGVGRKWVSVWGEVVTAPSASSSLDSDFAEATVVFGHDAKRRLQLGTRTYGLDTGCAYGGELTALLLPSRRLVSVPGYKKASI